MPRAGELHDRKAGRRLEADCFTTLSVGRVLVAADRAWTCPQGSLACRVLCGGTQVLGRSILENQGVAFALADISTKCHAAELMVRNAATLIDEDQSFRTETSMTKLFASELALEAANTAIQVHGGYGVP